MGLTNGKSTLLPDGMPQILGIGFFLPLFANLPLCANAFLGGVASLGLLIIAVFTARFFFRLSLAGRIGIALLLAGGILVAAGIVSQSMRDRFPVPLETLFPLFLTGAVRSACSVDSDAKRRLSPLVLQALFAGLCFTVLLCLACLLKSFFCMVRPGSPALPLNAFIRSVPGSLIIAAGAAALLQCTMGRERGER